MTTKTCLQGIEQIRQYFSENTIPMYFVSATNFNLLGIDEWVKHFRYINYIDYFDTHHPNLIQPKLTSPIVLESIEEMNNYLLENKDILDQIEAHKKGINAHAQCYFLFFDERTEDICKEAGLTCCMPPVSLIKNIDNKITTTEIGNEAGVASVPNALVPVRSYKELKEVCDTHNLSDDIVIQSAYGDSGKTTYFIKSEDDYNRYAEAIEKEDKVKVMKRLQCKGTAIEACVTRHGTITGPLLTELIGFTELTPYKGGWCGNELYKDAFSAEILKEAQEKVIKIGNQLQKRGYKGYFEVDFLFDLESQTLYLGELNPRITGISAMTNLSEAAQSTLPPFLFHILEYQDNLEYSVDVDAYNAHMLTNAASQSWGQLIIKYTPDDYKVITTAPQSGLYEMAEDGSVDFKSIQTQRRCAQKDNQAFFLRISQQNDYFYKGADMGILFIRQELVKDDTLTPVATQWIDGIHTLFTTRELTEEEQLLLVRYRQPGQLKTF